MLPPELTPPFDKARAPMRLLLRFLLGAFLFFVVGALLILAGFAAMWFLDQLFIRGQFMSVLPFGAIVYALCDDTEEIYLYTDTRKAVALEDKGLVVINGIERGDGFGDPLEETKAYSRVTPEGRRWLLEKGKIATE